MMGGKWHSKKGEGRNKEHQKEYNREYAINHREDVRRHNRESYQRHKEKRRDYRLKYQFGISLEDFEKILLSQGCKCAICGEQFIDQICVDHDHETRKVRGLLCHSCNKMLGHAHDNKNTLLKALKYLSGETIYVKN